MGLVEAEEQSIMYKGNSAILVFIYIQYSCVLKYHSMLYYCGVFHIRGFFAYNLTVFFVVGWMIMLFFREDSEVKCWNQGAEFRSIVS